MLVDSTEGIEGDRSRLITPRINILETLCLRFWLFRNISSNNAVASLAVLKQVCCNYFCIIF